MAELSAQEGHIDSQEAVILQNLLLLRKIKIKDGWPVNYWAPSIELYRFTTTLIK
jgi:hypothetical protein